MMQRMIDLKRHWRRYARISVPLLLIALALYTGFVLDICTAALYNTPFLGSYGPPDEYLGAASLEERIIGADAIARVQLSSVSQVVESNEFHGNAAYSRALKFDFKVLEYLKGSGRSDIVAYAFDADEMYKSKLGAWLFSDSDFLDNRDTNWDDKEAIVFLASNRASVPSSRKKDTYAIGVLRFNRSDYYSINSRYWNNWLPEDSAANSSVAAGSGGQSFLTGGVPVNIEVIGSFAQSDSSNMTLSALKARIADIEQEVSSGDGTDAYKECVHAKYVWAREMRFRHDYIMSVRPDLGWQGNEKHNFASGLSSSSDAFTEAQATFRAYGVAEGWEYWLTGKDKDLFSYVHPGIGKSVRPLPKGKYEAYAHHRLKKYILCDGYPDILKKYNKMSITVTHPTGTLHEAFFDPVAIGAGFGADATNGVLKPASFTPTGGSATTISGIGWEAEKVKIRLSPHTTLTDKHIDFLALDASVALRLDFDDATVVTEQDNTKSLTWGVCKQPWKAGDLLMLRISESEGDMADATNDASCLPATPTPTATPEPKPTATVIPSRTATPIPTATLIPTPTGPYITIGDATFAAEIADTPELRSKGLGERDSLPEQTGMLFVFPNGQASSFWMFGMRFPLDFVWIAEDCTVADLTENVQHYPPDTPSSELEIINPTSPAAYTFEINAGEVSQFGIEIGDSVQFHNINSEFAKCCAKCCENGGCDGN